MLLGLLRRSSKSVTRVSADVLGLSSGNGGGTGGVSPCVRVPCAACQELAMNPSLWGGVPALQLDRQQ